jgi:ribosomal subunit interface protein
MLRSIKISFHNMDHSDPMENHIRQKLQKVSDLLKQEENLTPLLAEFWLKANKQHTHHEAEFHLKTPRLNLHTHDSGPDMYIVIDNTIDKMVAQLKKEKELNRDKYRKIDSEKKRKLLINDHSFFKVLTLKKL